jgi:uncharacterized protein (DUF1697 family)
LSRDWVAFIRNNRVPRMAPLRDALAGAGLTDVASFGSSGNLVFCAGSLSAGELVDLASAALDQEVVLRSKAQLLDIVAGDPYLGQPEAGAFLFTGEIDGSAAMLRDARGSGGRPLVAAPGVVYYVGRPQMPGRAPMLDFERELGVRGTMRTSRVLARVLDMM